MSNREYRFWEKETDKPTNTEYYLMQIAMEIVIIRKLLTKEKLTEDDFDLRKFMIKFRQPAKKKSSESKRTHDKQTIELAKGKWAVALGGVSIVHKKKKKKKKGESDGDEGTPSQ